MTEVKLVRQDLRQRYRFCPWSFNDGRTRTIRRWMRRLVHTAGDLRRAGAGVRSGPRQPGAATLGASAANLHEKGRRPYVPVARARVHDPPFGSRNGHVPWLRKFLEHGNGVAIVRAYTSSSWFHEWAIKAGTMLFRGKTKFIRPDGTIGAAPDTALFCSGWARSPTPHSNAAAWVCSLASNKCHKLGKARVGAAAGVGGELSDPKGRSARWGSTTPPT